MGMTDTAAQNMAFRLDAASPAETGTIWHVAAPFAPWLWPGLACFGIGLQLVSAWRRSHMLAWAGFALVAAGAWPEKDISLAAGDLLACAGLSLSYAARPKK